MFQSEITVCARCTWVENFLARTVSKPSPGYSELGIVSLVYGRVFARGKSVLCEADLSPVFIAALCLHGMVHSERQGQFYPSLTVLASQQLC
jgi:hypothetical protein